MSNPSGKGTSSLGNQQQEQAADKCSPKEAPLQQFAHKTCHDKAQAALT